MTAPSREELADAAQNATAIDTKGGRFNTLGRDSALAIADAILARIGDGWRTMESAPRDGRTIIIFQTDLKPEYQVETARWDERCKCWTCDGTPVAWQPFPSPPGGGG